VDRVEADPGAVSLIETARDRLTKGLPGYRASDVDAFLDGVLAALRRGEPPSPAVVRAVAFPVTKWRTGYSQRDVDRLIGELAQLVGRPGADADAEASAAISELVDRIRSSVFRTTFRGGYDEEEVDKYLDQMMRALSRGERGTVWQLAGEARFTKTKLRPGYVVADVDGLLASVANALSDL
jgi:DivIVA domain-containing protein